ncbi:MAG: hypothetical protein M1828_005395 [Chrysothrix sp. TS-e1954]|nr:MAG: hypothetical protein M1828_005395 [Chrysothrix sp. TS-e1954]
MIKDPHDLDNEASTCVDEVSHPTDVAMGLLRINRFLGMEAAKALYQKNHFHFRPITNGHRRSAFQEFQDFVNRIGTRNRGFIQHVSIVTSVLDVYDRYRVGRASLHLYATIKEPAELVLFADTLDTKLPNLQAFDLVLNLGLPSTDDNRSTYASHGKPSWLRRMKQSWPSLHMRVIVEAMLMQKRPGQERRKGIMRYRHEDEEETLQIPPDAFLKALELPIYVDDFDSDRTRTQRSLVDISSTVHRDRSARSFLDYTGVTFQRWLEDRANSAAGVN